MTEPKKITERASELADQAAQAAGPAIEKAKEVAAEFAQKAAPVVERAAERAAELTAHGVSAAAEQLDKATKGKYSGKISSVATKLEDALDREHRAK